MKNQAKSITIIFLSFILLAQIAFIMVPTAKAFSLQDFSITPDPSAMPLLVGHSYDFTLTATLPGGSGSNGVDVYVLPQAGEVGTTGVVISYTSLGYGTYPLHIPANGNSASEQMTITIPADVAPGPLPLTVTAYDNPGGGGTIIGTFSVTLHVNQIPLVVQTSGLHSATNVYIDETKVGTAYDGVPYGPVWYPLNPSTGTVTIGAVGVDNTVSGTVQYFFSNWAGDPSGNPHPAITTSEPVTLTANYVTKTSQITITSNPTGSGFVNVDGTTYSTPKTFTWAVGSSHNLEALSPVPGISGTQYVYTSWSDGGAQSHLYTVVSTTSATVEATYKTQYSVTLNVNPTSAGTTNPAAATSIWADSGPLPISATANPGYHFDSWTKTGSISFADSTSTSTTASISGSGTITANFAFNDVTHFSVAAPSSVTAGQSFQATVTAFDASGNTIAGYTGTVHITSSDPQADLPSDATLTNGVGDFTITLKTANSQTITATDQAKPQITGSTFVTVIADSSSTRFVVDAPTSATAGVPFTFTVTAVDKYGNTVSDYSGTIHFTSTSSGTLPGDSTLSSGTGSFSATLTSTGYKTITATNKGLPSVSGTSNAILVAPGTALYSFSITGYPSSVNAGDVFGTDVVITAYDSFGNIKTDYTGSVYFTSTDAKATLPYTSTIIYAFTSVDAGSHPFSGSGFTLYTVGTHTITITDDAVSEESNGITVNHATGGASYFVVNAPATANAGSMIPVSVTAKDLYGNTVSDYSGTVTFTSTDSRAILPGDAALENGVGNFVATFITSGSQTITATDTSDEEVTGTSDVAVVGPSIDGASAFIVSAQSSSDAGSSFVVIVTAVDLYGNLVPYYDGTVRLSSSDAQWIGASDSTLTDGIGTFTVILKTAGPQTITATDTGDPLIAGSTTVQVTIDASSATHFDVAAPSFIGAGQSFSVTVTAKDQFGNTVTGYTGMVHFSTSDTGSKVSLPGNYVFVTDDAGARTFTGVVLVTSGSQTITASDIAAEISGSASIQINVPANSADHFIVSSQNSVTAGVSFVVTVTARDTFGNTVEGYSGTIHFTSTDNLAVLPSDFTFQASDSGSKAFDGIILETAGVQTITATETFASSITGTSYEITVTANADYPKTITASPSSAQISAGDSQSFTAELFDVYGNSLGDVTSLVTWSIDTAAGGSWEQATGTYTSAMASPGSSPWTIAASLDSLSGTAVLTVTHSTDISYLESIAIAPIKSTIAAGETQSYTATATDSFGNSWDVTAEVSATNGWSITAAAGGSWNGAVYTSEKAGSWIVTGTYLGKSATADLTVTHATDVAYLDHIAIAPKNSTIAAGISQSYNATAYDSFGNSWIVNAVYSCSNSSIAISGNSAHSNTTGSYAITGTFNSKSDTALLTVAGHLSTVVTMSVAPKTASITAGSSQAFDATASDGYNTWDVTNQVVWSILESGHGGSWNQATGTYTSAKAGTWTIQAALSSLSDTATLTVEANAQLLDHITISPKTVTISSGSSQSYSIAAYDQYDNSLGSVTSASIFAASGATVSGNSVSATSAGSYTVTATYNGKSDTATLTVTASSATSVVAATYTFTFIEKGLPTGKAWSTTFNGQTKSSTSNTITFNVPAGSYIWSAQSYVSETQESRYIAFGVSLIQISVPTTTSQIVTYAPQYKLSIISDHDTPVGANWYTAGVTANFSITSPDVSGDTRYVFTTWSGNLTSTSTNASIVMNNPKTVIANWQTQYYLTINSLYGNPIGAGWYNADSEAQFSVTSPATDNSGTQYALSSWTGTGTNSYSGTDNTQNVIMIGPITETANWEQASSLYSVLLIALIIFALILIALFLAWRRRRKKKQENKNNTANSTSETR